MAPPSNAQALALLAKAERFELYQGGHLFFFRTRGPSRTSRTSFDSGWLAPG